MARLTSIDESSTANDAINALNRAQTNNPGRIELYDAGKGHGQGWRFLTGGVAVATGSIPQSAHGSKNLKVALRHLEAMVAAHGIVS